MNILIADKEYIWTTEPPQTFRVVRPNIVHWLTEETADLFIEYERWYRTKKIEWRGNIKVIYYSKDLS